MKKEVVIDASHGGEDTGSIGNGIVEKDFVLDISTYINNKLKEEGINTLLVRNNDITLSDEQRVNIIKDQYGTNDDVIIISNRLNQSGDDGAEIIYSLRNNDNLASLIATNLESKGQNVNKYYQRRLPSNLSNDYDYLLRNTSPFESLIIEYGYVDSTGDDPNILKNYQILGDAVVNALLEYINKSNIYIVKSGDTLYSIARKYEVNVNDLKELNNLTGSALSIGQELIIPKTISNEVLSSLNNTHIVKSGDTLYSIAKRYNTNVNTIKELNNLTSNTLSIGTVLKVPSNNTYTVISGDTLYSIAKRYNTNVNTIKELNNLTSNILSIGMVLKI